MSAISSQYNRNSRFAYEQQSAQKTSGEQSHKWKVSETIGSDIISADALSRLKDFESDCKDVKDHHFASGKAEMYGNHQQQMDEYVRLMADDTINSQVKELALEALPGLSSSDVFKQTGIIDTLRILRTKKIQKAKLLLKVCELQRSQLIKRLKQSKLSTNLLGINAQTKSSADFKPDDDWVVYDVKPGGGEAGAYELSGEQINSLDTYLQEHLTPAHIVKNQAADILVQLLDSYSSPQSNDFVSISQHAKSLIGEEKFNQLMLGLKNLLTNKAYCDRNKEFLRLRKELASDIAAELYPVSTEASFYLYFKKGDALECTIKSDRTLVVQRYNDAPRSLTLADIKNLDFTSMHPHIRHDLIELMLGDDMSCQLDDVVDLFSDLELYRTDFKGAELYKYHLWQKFGSFICEHFNEAEFSDWLDKQSESTKIMQIFYSLRDVNNQSACLIRLIKLKQPFPELDQAMTAGMVIAVNDAAGLSDCPTEALFRSLESLCSLKASETISKAIKLIALEVKQREKNPEMYARSLFIAAQCGNAAALTHLYKLSFMKKIKAHLPQYPHPPEVYAIRSGNVEALKAIMKHHENHLLSYKPCGLLFAEAAGLNDTACIEYLLSQPSTPFGRLNNSELKDFICKVVKAGNYKTIIKVLEHPVINHNPLAYSTVLNSTF